MGYAENIQYMGRLQTQNMNSGKKANGSEQPIRNRDCGLWKKSPAGDKRIMRMKKGAIFSPSRLSSQKFKTADFIQNIRRKCLKTLLIHSEECVQLYLWQNVHLKKEPAFMYVWLLSEWWDKTGYRNTKIKVYVLSNYFGLTGCDIHFLTKCVRKSSIQNDE